MLPATEELRRYGESLVDSARQALGSDLVTKHGSLYAVRLTEEHFEFLRTRAMQIENLIEASTGKHPGPITPSDVMALLVRKYKEETQYVPE